MMNCNEIYNDLVQYSEGNSSGDKKALVESHLKKCPDCRITLAILTDILNFIEAEKQAVPNEFLYTRVMAGLETAHAAGKSWFSRLAPAIVASLMFLIAIWSGFSLGKYLSNPQDDMSFIVREENRYLNDLKQESIENFFLSKDNSNE